METLDSQGGASLGPMGLDWHDLCRGPLDIATCETYKLWVIPFIVEDFLKFFPLLVYGSYMVPWQP